jgi:hypothetical protein
MIGEAVVCPHSYIIKCNCTLLPERPGKHFHIGMVLIVGLG